MNKFFQNLKAVLGKLGLQAKFEKKELSAEEQAALVQAYDEAYGEKAFATDSAAYITEKEQLARAAEQDKMFRELAATLGNEGEDGNLMEASQIVEAVKDLQATVERLGAQSQGNHPVDQVKNTVKAFGAHTDKFAFGVQNPLFAANKRHNRIAIDRAVSGTATQAEQAAFREDFSAYTDALGDRMKMHAQNGTLGELAKAGADFSALTSDKDLGARYLEVRQDALIARIVSLPSLDGLFTKVSNVQSGNVITNVLFTEVSQAYQKGRVFKGNVDFKPEKALVDKAMAKLQFEDMSALELSYLNYLNTSGSDPVKWSLIEWIILEMAKLISNERNRRYIMGHRIEPTEKVAGHTMFASTGVIHRLFGLFDEHKVLPFLDGSLASYTKEDIGDAFILFAELLAKAREDWQSFVIYANMNHKPWYTSWYEKNYGKNTDYTGPQAKVPDYDLPIKWVPFMGNLPFIFATVPGNIKLLENVPGEEYKMQFQRDLEEVLAFSYWKEGTGVAFAGIQRKDLAELKSKGMEDQLIFMNWPAVEVAADAVIIDASKGIIFRTAENSKATVLTDLKDAKEGVVYRIECGSATNATTIAKSGKFAEIKEAWAPKAVGEYIKLYYDKKAEKFYEVSRG